MDAPTKSIGPVVIDGLEFPFLDYPAQGSAIEVADGIFWVSTPVPFVGLKQVNLYAFDAVHPARHRLNG